MNLIGYDWNVVVIGFWNPAILTPEGIARRLFGLEKGTPIAIEVPIEGLAPYRVKHDDLIVTAETGRLAVSPNAPNYVLLDRARGIAVRAIEALPETPVTATGFNIRVSLESPPEALFRALTPSLDALLSDADFSIEARLLHRALKCGEGILNLSIEQRDKLSVQLNFHRQSTKGTELVSWLRQPIEDVQDIVASIFEKVIGIPPGDLGK